MQYSVRGQSTRIVPVLQYMKCMDRMTRCRVMAILNIPQCEVGRRSVVNIHTSYTDLIILIFDSARGVKNNK